MPALIRANETRRFRPDDSDITDRWPYSSSEKITPKPAKPTTLAGH